MLIKSDLKSLILELFYFNLKSKRKVHILGIESSCDDAAVSIICSKERRILCDKRSSDFRTNSRMKGIIPFSAARHHRETLPRLIREAFIESGIRASDINAVAVTNRPGIVNSLKVGIEYALCFARTYSRPIIPIHHMRAHALIERLLNKELNYPFITLLISGAHCLLCAVYSCIDFKILFNTQSGSPGECLDKLARELGLQQLNGHYGAALEHTAKRYYMEERIDKPRYSLTLPKADIFNDLDFDMIKGRYLRIIKNKGVNAKQNDQKIELCAGIQYTIAEYICQHLNLALSFISSRPEFNSLLKKHLVMAGGVASNDYFFKRISETSLANNFTVLVPPPHLCTDNGIMIAWAGFEMFSRQDIIDTIYWPNNLPDFLWASHKSLIGPKMEISIK